MRDKEKQKAYDRARYLRDGEKIREKNYKWRRTKKGKAYVKAYNKMYRDKHRQCN